MGTTVLDLQIRANAATELSLLFKKTYAMRRKRGLLFKNEVIRCRSRAHVDRDGRSGLAVGALIHNFFLPTHFSPDPMRFNARLVKSLVVRVTSTSVQAGLGAM